MISPLGCQLDVGCEVSPGVVTPAHLLDGCASLTDLNTELSCSSHRDDNAQQLLSTARPTVNVIGESQCLLLHCRKFSNSKVHLEHSLDSRCGCMLQSTQGSPCFLGKQQRAEVRDVEMYSVLCNFDYCLKKLEKNYDAIL